jgi:MFS family permease
VFENVVCEEYYDKRRSALYSNPPTLQADPCKAQAVQTELALVRGVQQLVPLFAALLCTLPYGLLTERVGRRRILILSGVGVFASLSWVLAVCYWQFVPLRWVWLSGVFLFIGGGDAVSSSVIHVMVTDTTDQAERAQIFLYLHAADVVSGFFGPAISAALMEKGYTWTVLLLADIVLFSGAFLLTLFIPETLHSSDEHSLLVQNDGPSDPTLTEEEPIDVSLLQNHEHPLDSATQADSFLTELFNLVSPLLTVLASNPQAVLLLVIFAPQSAARDLFSMVGLQYSSAKFGLPYSRGSLILSLFQCAQGLFVLLLLPLITRFVAEPLGWSSWARDRYYTIVSVSVTAIGLMAIAVAPVLAVEAVGLLLVALGSCTTGLLMSLLGDAVRPSQVSAVYSAALMLSIISRSIMGPVVNALLVGGLKLGWVWMGLPFGFVAVLLLGVALATGFIRKEKKEGLAKD